MKNSYFPIEILIKSTGEKRIVDHKSLPKNIDFIVLRTRVKQ